MSESESSYKQELQAVRQLDESGAVAPYVEAAERLVVEYPKKATAWLEWGVALIEIARYDDARKALDRSLRLSTKSAFHHIPLYWIGHLYKEKGNLPLAERWFRRSLEADSTYPESWAMLGAVLAKQGRFKEAKAAWRKQIKLNTGATDEGHVNLGLILRAEKRYKEALEHAEKALALDPGYKEAKALRKDLLQVLQR